MPSWRNSSGGSSGGINTSLLSSGYNKTWRSLSVDERESAMVFMLGRVLWCIFEGVGSSTGGNSADFLGEDLFRDSGNGNSNDPNQQQFPEFRDTPEAMQVLIREATSGAMEWAGLLRCVRVVGDRIYGSQSKMDGDEREEAYATARALRAWWNARISSTEEYLVERATGGEECDATSARRSRPRLRTVLRALQELEKGGGSDVSRLCTSQSTQQPHSVSRRDSMICSGLCITISRSLLSHMRAIAVFAYPPRFYPIESEKNRLRLSVPA